MPAFVIACTSVRTSAAAGSWCSKSPAYGLGRAMRSASMPKTLASNAFAVGSFTVAAVPRRAVAARGPTTMDELTSLSSANGAWTVIALRTGGPGFFQRLATALFCEQCGQDTRHEVLCVGQRIAEVRCAACGQAMGMDRREVIRAFIGEVVLQALRIPHDVRRELKEGLGTVVAQLPGQVARLPVRLAQDARHLLRMARPLEGDRARLQALVSDVETVLLCAECQQETPHRLLYLGRRIAQARCETCGHRTGRTREDILSDYLGEVILHLLLLPRQVRRELRTDVKQALRSLPRELSRVPFALGRDVVRLVRLLR